MEGELQGDGPGRQICHNLPEPSIDGHWGNCCFHEKGGQSYNARAVDKHW